MGVLEFLCNIRFHSTFVLPPNSETGRDKPYRVSYSDFGDPTSNAVVLLCGAMMGTRLSYSPLDQLAYTHNVRIIHPDRPGIGGSDPVKLDKRIQTWLEVVPQLLAHLNISHVALASHSGGDIYLLNTLLTYPHLLHPETPYVSFFAPWVHPSHSKVTHMRATELLPSPMIGKFASLAKFINGNVTPLTYLSGSLVQGIKSSLLRSMHAPAPVALTPSVTRSRNPSIRSTEGYSALELNDPEVLVELEKQIMLFLFAEAIDGISADAQLFMRKPRSIPWSLPSSQWSDIDSAVMLFSKIINEEGYPQRSRRKWTVHAFHAEKDEMVGDKGRQWFDDCWSPSQDPSSDAANASSQLDSEQPQINYEYRSIIVPGTSHNYLMDPAFKASEQWLQQVRDAFPILIGVS